MRNNIIRRSMNGDFDRLFDTMRWNSSNFVFQKESLAAHQYMVAYFANALALDLSFGVEARLNVLEYALHHDWDEIFTGDIGHEVKYNQYNGLRIRESLEELIRFSAQKEFLRSEYDSEIVIGRIIADTHEYAPCVKMLVKVCDWLSMLFFCVREVKLGNTYFLSKMMYCIDSCVASVDKFWDQLLIDSGDNADFLTVFAPEEEFKQELIDIINSFSQLNNNALGMPMVEFSTEKQ